MDSKKVGLLIVSDYQTIVQIVDTTDHDTVGVSDAELLPLIAALQQIAKERGLMEADVCKWTLCAHDGDRVVECTGYTERYFDGWEYCPFCGRKIRTSRRGE